MELYLCGAANNQNTCYHIGGVAGCKHYIDNGSTASKNKQLVGVRRVHPNDITDDNGRTDLIRTNKKFMSSDKQRVSIQHRQAGSNRIRVQHWIQRYRDISGNVRAGRIVADIIIKSTV
jgi:hypothetical protein